MRKIFFLILLVTVFSCGEKFSRFNRNQNIPKRKFVSILAEIHIMETITGRHEYYQKFSSKDSVDTYNNIIEKYGYTREDFDSTVAAYTRRPELYEKVYNEVLMKLNYMLDTLRKNDPKFERNTLNE
jgi:hypothetical protein